MEICGVLPAGLLLLVGGLLILQLLFLLLSRLAGVGLLLGLLDPASSLGLFPLHNKIVQLEELTFIDSHRLLHLPQHLHHLTAHTALMLTLSLLDLGGILANAMRGSDLKEKKIPHFPCTKAPVKAT